MTISLSNKTQALFDELLKSGEYHSADEAVSAAIEALHQFGSRGLNDDALDAIDRAEEQIEKGQVHEWSAVRDRVRA